MDRQIFPLRISVVAALLSLLASVCVAAVGAGPQPQCVITRMADGGYKITNPAAMARRVTTPNLRIDRPIIFELGREGRHLRRIYNPMRRATIDFEALPGTEYLVYPTDAYVDGVLKQVCRVEPRGLSRVGKLDALASAADEGSKADRHSRRLALEALQALLGIEFSARMQYPSHDGGDYRIYAGGDFEVTCTAWNTGSEEISGTKFDLMGPDEWTVKPANQDTSRALGSRSSTTGVFSVKAPERSALRAPVSPVIAIMNFTYSGRQFTIHYPFNVELSDPFRPTLRIRRAYPDRIQAHIDLETLYPGREMKGISVYPWLDTDLTIGPEGLKADMDGGKGGFSLTYLPQPKTASYRAVTVIMKLDEHLVRLRSVMEARLDLGSTTRGAALWMNSTDDGKAAPGTIDGVKCRKTVSGSKYVYFAASPNVPRVGATYVSVTYCDTGSGSIRLEYDGEKGAYTECRDAAWLQGSHKWKTKTFVLNGIMFSDRQNGKSDFRLVGPDGNLAVARVVVSKFTPGEPD